MKDFTCKECGHNRIEEVMVDVTVSSAVTDIFKVGDNEICCNYGEQSNEDGEVQNYQCMNCGANVDIDTMLELAEDEEDS